MSRITDFYRISPPAPGREMDDDARSKYYRRLRLQAFVAATLGYSLYYVCRTSLNVMKKPILDSGSLDASQLGVIGSALLFAYAVGKFVNGFIADYCNIKRWRGRLSSRLPQTRPDGTAGAGAFRSSHGRDIRGIRRHVGTERMGAVHGSAPGHHIPLAVVSPPGTGNLLRILLRKP